MTASFRPRPINKLQIVINIIVILFYTEAGNKNVRGGEQKKKERETVRGIYRYLNLKR